MDSVTINRELMGRKGGFTYAEGDTTTESSSSTSFGIDLPSDTSTSVSLSDANTTDGGFLKMGSFSLFTPVPDIAPIDASGLKIPSGLQIDPDNINQYLSSDNTIYTKNVKGQFVDSNGDAFGASTLDASTSSMPKIPSGGSAITPSNNSSDNFGDTYLGGLIEDNSANILKSLTSVALASITGQKTATTAKGGTIKTTAKAPAAKKATNNTVLYVGIGVAVFAIIIIGVVASNRKSSTIAQ